MVKVNSLVVCLVASPRDRLTVRNMETVTIDQVLTYGALRGRSLAAVYATPAAMADPRYDDTLKELEPCVLNRSLGRGKRVLP